MQTKLFESHHEGAAAKSNDDVFDASVEHLVKHGWARFHAPTIAGNLASAVIAFDQLWQCSDAAFFEINDPREFDESGKSDLGLIMNRRGETKENPRLDEIAEGRSAYDSSKYFFHYHPRVYEYYAGHRLAAMEHAAFFGTAYWLRAHSIELGTRIAQKLDERMSGHSFAARLQEAESMHKLRVLHYPGDGVRPDVAQCHRDKDFLTVHIGSDREGLWLVDNDGTIIENTCETATDSVIVFFGRRAWEMTQGALRGVPHGVRSTTDGGTRTPRRSAVVFLHAVPQAEEALWSRAHVSELTLPEHVRLFGMSE